MSIALILMGLAGTADAAEVTINKKGLEFAFVHIDGVAHGKTTKKAPVVTELEPGPHEFWVSNDEAGVFVRCRGIAEVGASGLALLVKDSGCDGLKAGDSPAGTRARGATLHVSGPAVSGQWIGVDGGRSIVSNHKGLTVDLAPGQHALIVADDVSSKIITCKGTLTVAAGEKKTLVITEAGCVGFDQPDVNINITVQ